MVVVLPLCMLNIYDLQITRQLLPLFDDVPNEMARDKLIGLFTELPASIKEIETRQQIVKTIHMHLQLLKPLRYALSELMEVYEGTMQNKDRQALLEKAGNFPFSTVAGKMMQQQKGKVIQTLSLFNRMYEAYFKNIDITLFPGELQSGLINVKHVFKDLEVVNYSSSISKKLRKNRASLAKMKVINDKVSAGKMTEFWNTIFLFEAYLSIARAIRRYNMQFPVFNTDTLLLEEFYFPLIKNPVKNNLKLTPGVTLLTGPNMSGKSTVLRSLGLSVYLAHLGFAVPAAKCEMPFYHSITIAINVNDDVQNGYSHFMTEVTALKNVIVQAAEGKRCFAVFDELFRGTNGEDAMTISTITIEGLQHLSDS